MKAMVMDGKQIRKVTPEGVVYLDENGDEQFIDFAACYKNYFTRRTSPEEWEVIKKVNNKTDVDWEWYVERVKRWREVGGRQILTPPLADGPYIEFHTEPSTRFKFETEQEFQKVRNAIGRTGWKTGDLS
jgi:hypothetical protein